MAVTQEVWPVAYDEGLSERIRRMLAERDDVTERKMFGGIAFMVGGNMAVGVIREDLMVRVGPEAHAAALDRPHARPMDFAKRPMVGYVYVAPDGVRTEADLRRWVDLGASFASSLPAK